MSIKHSHGWPPASIRQRMVDHQSLETAIRALSSDTPEEIERALVRYLTLRSAGLIEAIRDDATDTYTQRVGSGRLHRRISSGLRNGQGVAPQQLLDFVGSFDTDWRDQLLQFLAQDDNRRSNELGALVSMRKKIAHGDGDQVTTRKALQWSTTAGEISSWLVTRFDPT